MNVFRPMNSDESNLFKIRLSIGFGSPLGVFDTNTNTLNNNDIIASNNSSNIVTKNHLSAPTNNLLPQNFYIKYIIDGSVNKFEVFYNDIFTQQPSVQILPHTNAGNIITSNIVKKDLSGNDSNLEIYFSQIASSISNSIAVSTNGTSGLLGFDLEITGPIKLGITTGNSNKGWALSSSNSLYSYFDTSIGTSLSTTDSFVLGKNLCLLSKDGTIKKYTTSTSSLDYSTSVWLINDSVSLTTVTPKLGMTLIIISTDNNFDTTTNSYTSNPTVTLNSGCSLNYSTNNLITFTRQAESIILYGISSTQFIVLNKSENITLSS
jgi:hypothetical protein